MKVHIVLRYCWCRKLLFVSTDQNSKSFKNWCISKTHLLTQILSSDNKNGVIVFLRTK